MEQEERMRRKEKKKKIRKRHGSGDNKSWLAYISTYPTVSEVQ